MENRANDFFIEFMRLLKKYNVDIDIDDYYDIEFIFHNADLLNDNQHYSIGTFLSYHDDVLDIYDNNAKRWIKCKEKI